MYRPLLAATLLLVPAAMAQERAAGQSYDAQVNWSILNDKINALNVRDQALQAVLDQMKLCGAAGKVYAPGTPSADPATGCVNAGGGVPDAVIDDEKAAGSEGGTYSGGGWVIRTFNNKVYDPSNLITLSGNQFKPASNVWLEWSCPGYDIGRHQTRLFNVTNNVPVVYGTSTYSSAVSTDSRSEGGYTLAAGKTYRIEHRASGSKSTQGLGHSANSDKVEIFCRAKFWKAS